MTKQTGEEARGMAEAARDWALALTRQLSTSGSAEEAIFAAWLADELRKAFGERADVWSLPVREGDSRQNVFMLLRGAGRETVILTGHFDTVTTDDYGDLKPLATEPETLLPALIAKLERKERTPAEARALADLRSGAYLPGRGLLDMKAGLAAGLAVCERFAADGAARGNLLFLGVPDEEVNSAGARGAAAALSEVARDRELDLVAAINLDSIADDGDGSLGRIVAQGTIGKLLPTAFVAGVAAHAGFPLNGINAGALAAAIAERVEWAPELTDDRGDGPRTPPSLLSLHDGKRGYDVTTPRTAFVTLNVLTAARSPDEVLTAFDRLCAQAAADWLDRLRAKARALADASRLVDSIADIPVHRFEDVAELARSRDAAALETAAREAAASGLSLPDQCWAITERAWDLSGLPGPAVVTGFGSTPYLATFLSPLPQARKLARAAEAAAALIGNRHGTSIRTEPFFAGISDMSFLGEGDAGALDLVARNTPAFALAPGASPVAVAGIPIVNAGPWGRDYHTPLERMETTYAFNVLPELLQAIVDGILPR